MQRMRWWPWSMAHHETGGQEGLKTGPQGGRLITITKPRAGAPMFPPHRPPAQWRGGPLSSPLNWAGPPPQEGGAGAIRPSHSYERDTRPKPAHHEPTTCPSAQALAPTCAVELACTVGHGGDSTLSPQSGPAWSAQTTSGTGVPLPAHKRWLSLQPPFPGPYLS